MDRLDVALLQEMSRDSVYWWGGPDPRVSSDLLARRVGSAGSTVRARLRRWEETGFLRGSLVLPSPRIFGAALATGMLAVGDRAAKAEVLRALRETGSVVAVADHAGPSLGFAFVAASASEAEATVSRIAHLPAVRGVWRGGHPPVPTTPLSISGVDRRILDALRRDPHARVGDVVDELGISARTFTRRYQRLVDERAMLFWLLLDFGKLPGVVTSFRVLPTPETPPRVLAERVTRSFPDAISVKPPHSGGDHVDVALFRACVPAMEDAHVAILEVPGVADAAATHLRRIEVMPAWFDRQRHAVGSKCAAPLLAPLVG